VTAPLAPTGAPEPTPAERRTKTATLLLRILAFVFVTVLVLGGHGVFGWGHSTRADHLGLVVGALILVGALLAALVAIDAASSRGRQTPKWGLVGVLSAMGVVAGLVTAVPVAASMVAFAALAATSAGSELPMGQAASVAASSILAIEISSLAFGFNNGDVGWPLIVIACLLGGRYRRDARVQHAQAAALLAQSQRTRVQEQRAATLDERTRIAREIHDILAHSLGALGIQIEAAQALLTDAGDIDRAVPLLEGARRLAASGLEETRRAIEALRTDTPPLPQSLATLAEAHIDQHRTPVAITVTGAPCALTPDANLALIRTAQEALANAARHAPAAPIAIALDYGPDRTAVTITNRPDPARHGPGAPITAARGAGGGYGLAGMRERLLLIGGTLTAGPSVTGWTVRAQIPR
jgi:signal transduction histidine kinase